MPCPDKLERLIGILMRFRENKFACTGDIVSFFHMIRIPKEDQDFNCFLWFENGDLEAPIVEYRLVKHLFGGVASQCCAVMALNHCFKKQVPHRWTEEFSQQVIQSFYADDFLGSYTTAAEAIDAVKDISKELSENGFELAKIRSNVKDIEQAIHGGDEEQSVEVMVGHDGKSEESALGVAWNLHEDVLLFRMPRPTMNMTTTKRLALSVLMSTYDRLGLVVPFLLPLKLFVQKLVVKKYDWDTPLEAEDEAGFFECIQNLERVMNIKIQ